MRNVMGKIIDIKLSRGTQIWYVPDHIRYNGYDGKLFAPDGITPGFVTSGPNKDGAYFCRYWSWDYKQAKFVRDLRTKANSELTDHRNLIVAKFFGQPLITATLKMIDGEGF